MKLIIITIFTSLMFTSCLTSDSDFRKVEKELSAQGYINIQETGYSWFCCGDDYSFKTGWRATNANGENVEGCACSDWFKGVDIKYK